MNVQIQLLTKTSKNGNTYQAVFAILPNGKEILLSFDKKLYYIIRKEYKQ